MRRGPVRVVRKTSRQARRASFIVFYLVVIKNRGSFCELRFNSRREVSALRRFFSLALLPVVRPSERLDMMLPRLTIGQQHVCSDASFVNERDFFLAADTAHGEARQTPTRA